MPDRSAETAPGPVPGRGGPAGGRLPLFGRLRTKLTVYFLTLFILVLLGTVSAVYLSVERNAERVVSHELTASAVVFDRVLQLRTGQLENSAALLSRDFGFRAAVATQDSATVRSALDNLRRRTGLHLGLVTSADGRVLASEGRPQLAGGADWLPAAVDGETMSGVVVLPDGPYEAVAEPIMAPVQIGQVVFATRLDAQELSALVRLSPIEFRPQVLVQGANGRWRSGAAGLSQAELAHAAATLRHGDSERPGAAKIGPWMEVVRPLKTLGPEHVALVLRYPMAEALAPYRGLLALVVLFGAGGLGLVAIGGALLAREVTRPIAALGLAAERLERGEASRVAVKGQDEIAALGLSFNRMADEIRRRERALDLARQAAESANRAKSEFLANMSHEIRTPLNGILGMAQVIARDDLDATQSARLKVIRQSGEALLGVLNSILDLSKIEAGQLEIEAADFDLAATVAAACDPFAALAADKGLRFDILIEPGALGSWRGDALRLRQVLSNLSSNAVKFTEQGAITLRVQAAEGALAFNMADTGVGIPAERLGEIFDKFAQVDASSTRRFGGTGLGLAICRELVSLMGGEMRVTSESGCGSSFAFQLPLARTGAAAAAQVREPTPQPLPSLRILAAEDNETNRLILAALLEPAGVELRLVSDGAEAVAAFAEESFDLVLMDIQMPGMNGVEAARAIRRAEARTGLPPTPILAVSANVMAHQVRDYLSAGMDGVLPKPLQAEVLFARIEQALAAPEEEAMSARGAER